MDGAGDDISGILNSALLNKQFAQEDDDAIQTFVHDHLKSASMLKGQFYQDLLIEDGRYCRAFEDGQQPRAEK